MHQKNVVSTKIYIAYVDVKPLITRKFKLDYLTLSILPKCTYRSGSFCFIMSIGSVCRNNERAAPNSLSSINSITI